MDNDTLGRIEVLIKRQVESQYPRRYDAEDSVTVTSTKRKWAWLPYRVASIHIENGAGGTMYLAFNKEHGDAFPIAANGSLDFDIDAESVWMWTATGTTTVKFLVALRKPP